MLTALTMLTSELQTPQSTFKLETVEISEEVSVFKQFSG